MDRWITISDLIKLIKEIFLWGVGVLYWKRYISATHKLKEHKIAFFKQNKNSFFLRRRHIVVQYLCVLPGWRRRLWEKKMMRQRSLHCLNLPRQRWQLVSTIFLQNGAPVIIMWGNTWNVQDCDYCWDIWFSGKPYSLKYSSVLGNYLAVFVQCRASGQGKLDFYNLELFPFALISLNEAIWFWNRGRECGNFCCEKLLKVQITTLSPLPSVSPNIDDEKLPINPFLYSFAAEKPNIWFPPLIRHDICHWYFWFG